MVRAADIVSEEHGWIERLLDCLDELVAGYRSRDAFDPEAAAELQSLFEHFVDGLHQAKEEEGLFPKLAQRLQQLQAEHASEREKLERMRYHLFGAAVGDRSGREAFARAAEEYGALQREHLRKEQLGLLPLARQLLDKDDEREVLAVFQRLEAAGPDRSQVRGRVRRLCETLGVPFEERPVAPA